METIVTAKFRFPKWLRWIYYSVGLVATLQVLLWSLAGILAVVCVVLRFYPNPALALTRILR